MAILALVITLVLTAAAAEPGLQPQYHHHGRRRRGHVLGGPPPPPGPGPSPPSPAPPSPPSPPAPLPPCDQCRCNCSDTCHMEPDPPFRLPQPGVGAGPAAGGARGGGGGGAGGRGGGPRRRPWYGRYPIPGAAPAPPAGGASSTECVAPLAELMACGAFVTGSETETPTPKSECCVGLGGFLNTSTAAAGYGNDRILRCLCPVILGDVNRMLPKPIDPVRLMYLPIACGVVLPPQVLYICFTGQQSLPLVGHTTDVSWDNSSSSSAAVSP